MYFVLCVQCTYTLCLVYCVYCVLCTNTLCIVYCIIHVLSGAYSVLYYPCIILFIVNCIILVLSYSLCTVLSQYHPVYSVLYYPCIIPVLSLQSVLYYPCIVSIYPLHPHSDVRRHGMMHQQITLTCIISHLLHC